MKSQLAGYRAARGRKGSRPSSHRHRTNHGGWDHAPRTGWESTARLISRIFGYRKVA